MNRTSVVARMSDDLVIEILARLPTKSLRRFQFVSKAWRGFISEEVLARRRILLPMSGFLFHPRHHEEGYCRELESHLSSLPFYSNSQVVHSCNGLLLFKTTKHYDGPRSFIVCNPATVEFVVLPQRRRRRRHDYSLCFLAFDPRESPHYKVVRFTLQYVEALVTVDIYSSMSGNWVDLSFPRKGSVCPYKWGSMSVFHKGALHMLDLDEHKLVRFHVGKEDFHVLSLPKVLLVNYPSACIGESRGNLYYAKNMFDYTNDLRIWMFDEGSANKWLLKHRMGTEVFDEYSLTCDPADNGPALNFRPIAFHPDSEVIYLSTRRKVLAYHPSSERLEEIFRVTNTGACIDVFTVIPCLESIDPPGGTYYPTSKINPLAPSTPNYSGSDDELPYVT